MRCNVRLAIKQTLSGHKIRFKRAEDEATQEAQLEQPQFVFLGFMHRPKTQTQLSTTPTRLSRCIHKC